MKKNIMLFVFKSDIIWITRAGKHIPIKGGTKDIIDYHMGKIDEERKQRTTIGNEIASIRQKMEKASSQEKEILGKQRQELLTKQKSLNDSIDKRKAKIEESGQIAPKEAPIPIEQKYKQIAESEATEWGNEQFDDWASKVTTQERGSLKQYTDWDGMDLNDAIRQNALETNHRQMMKNIDSALSKSSIPTDIVVFRGMSRNDDVVDRYKKAVGTTIREKAYVSTSLNPDVVKHETFGNGEIFMKIKVPKGAKGAFIEHKKIAPEISENVKEVTGHELQEILLSRNSNFKILSVTDKNNIINIDAELLKE